jgi:hypothetical protein
MIPLNLTDDVLSAGRVDRKEYRLGLGSRVIAMERAACRLIDLRTKM